MAAGRWRDLNNVNTPMSTAFHPVNNNSSDASGALVHPPLDVLLGGNGKGECIITAQSLAVSDQHATLLCTHTPRDDEGGSSDDGADGDDEKATAKTTSSILKMTLVPYHKSLLGSNPVMISSNGSNMERKLERNTSTNDPIASADIISFLRNYEYELKSESGAEYHHYIARPTGGRTLHIKEETDIDIDDDGSNRNNVGAFDV